MKISEMLMRKSKRHHRHRRKMVYRNRAVTHRLVLSHPRKAEISRGTKRSLFWKLFIFFLVALLFFFLGLRVRIWASRSPYFQSEISVVGNKFFQAEEIIRMSGIKPRVNVFAINRQQLKEKISQSPRIKSVKISYWPLNHLIIRIKEREAVAYVGNKWAIDGEGKLFPRSGENSSLPVINYWHNSSPAKSHLLSLLAVLQYLDSRLPDLKISRLEVYSQENVSLIAQGGKIEVRLGGEDFLSRLPLLVPVWNDLQQRGKVIHYIDLRFSGQVVVG